MAAFIHLKHPRGCNSSIEGVNKGREQFSLTSMWGTSFGVELQLSVAIKYLDLMTLLIHDFHMFVLSILNMFCKRNSTQMEKNDETLEWPTGRQEYISCGVIS